MPRISKYRWRHNEAYGGVDLSSTGLELHPLTIASSGEIDREKECTVLCTFSNKTTNDDTKKTSGVVGWYLCHKDELPADLDHGDTKTFWRPKPWTIVGIPYANYARHTMRWPRITVPPDYHFGVYTYVAEHDLDVSFDYYCSSMHYEALVNA